MSGQTPAKKSLLHIHPYFCSTIIVSSRIVATKRFKETEKAKQHNFTITPFKLHVHVHVFIQKLQSLRNKSLTVALSMHVHVHGHSLA